MRTIAIAIIAVSLLLTGCRWIEPPDYDAQLELAFENGAVGACLRTIVAVTGQDIPPGHRLDVLALCEMIAAETKAMALELPVPRLMPQELPADQPQAQPLPTRVPGSEL